MLTGLPLTELPLYSERQARLDRARASSGLAFATSFTLACFCFVTGAEYILHDIWPYLLVSVAAFLGAYHFFRTATAKPQPKEYLTCQTVSRSSTRNQ